MNKTEELQIIVNDYVTKNNIDKLQKAILLDIVDKAYNLGVNRIQSSKEYKEGRAMMFKIDLVSLNHQQLIEKYGEGIFEKKEIDDESNK